MSFGRSRTSSIASFGRGSWQRCWFSIQSSPREWPILVRNKIRKTMVESVHNLTYQMHLSTMKGTFWTRKGRKRNYQEELDQLREAALFSLFTRDSCTSNLKYALNLFLVLPLFISFSSDALVHNRRLSFPLFHRFLFKIISSRSIPSLSLYS